MKRRNVLKGLALSVAALAVPTVAMALPKPVFPQRPVTTRLVYLVKPWSWRGYREERPFQRQLFQGRLWYVRAPREDARGFDLVKIEFADLKKGDVFVVYEDTGELVGNLGGNPVMIAESDAYLDKAWTVETEIYKETFDIPKNVRDIR